jgi:hypothetical protein
VGRRRPKVECAKRTQFRATPRGTGPGDEGRIVQNEPNLPRRAEKTIVKAQGLGDATRRPVVAPNKPNVVRGSRESSAWREGRYGELDRQRAAAKQSQFSATPRGTGAIVRNKANSSRARRARGRRGVGRGAIVQNKANLPGRSPGPAVGEFLLPWTARGVIILSVRKRPGVSHSSTMNLPENSGLRGPRRLQ